MRALNVRTLLAILLVGSIGVNIYLLVPKQAEPDFYAPIIAKAIRWEAHRGKTDEASVARLNVPSVIEFREETCVQLSPGWGVAGGPFDRLL